MRNNRHYSVIIDDDSTRISLTHSLTHFHINQKCLTQIIVKQLRRHNDLLVLRVPTTFSSPPNQIHSFGQLQLHTIFIFRYSTRFLVNTIVDTLVRLTVTLQDKMVCKSLRLFFRLLASSRVKKSDILWRVSTFESY